MNYLSVNFKITDSNQSEQLVALLSEQQFEGFEETDQYLKAFIPQKIFDESAFSSIVQLFPSLVYTKESIENINWNQQWEESFEPVLINDFVAIRAGFHQPITNVLHEIIITPKMSFGTGHHATTHLMVQQMEQLNFVEKTVLDFGTGTGILAILAEKLGASKVLAIDIDEWSITNAKENIQQNSCNKIRIAQHKTIPVVQNYDIILANINLNVIMDSLSLITKVSNASCTILLSGFLKENEIVIQQAISEVGFQYLSTFQRGEWIVIMAVKQ